MSSSLKRVALLASIVGSADRVPRRNDCQRGAAGDSCEPPRRPPAQQWVVEAYLLTLSSLLLVGGSLGDLFGRRRRVLDGPDRRSASARCCARSPRASGLLIGARGVQGVAGALLVPSTLALIVDTFAEHERAAAIGIVDGVDRRRDRDRAARGRRARPGGLVAVDLRDQPAARRGDAGVARAPARRSSHSGSRRRGRRRPLCASASVDRCSH